VARVGLSLEKAMKGGHRNRRSCTLYSGKDAQSVGVRGHRVHRSLAQPADKQPGHIIEFRYQWLYGVSLKGGRAKVVEALVMCTTIIMDVGQYKLNTSMSVPTTASEYIVRRVRRLAFEKSPILKCLVETLSNSSVLLPVTWLRLDVERS